MGITMAQKILARASGRDFVEPGQYVVAQVDRGYGARC
jgi:aconitase B